MGGEGTDYPTKKCCTECIQRCLAIHGKKDPSPIACSFFKVLIDDRFSEVLFMPPKFARNACSTLGKKTHLEDSTGQRWRVRLSTINGSLAFQRGWDQFASDHFLRIGQFLVFRYVVGSHFMVQIYDESGCEKLNFSQKMNYAGGRKKADPKLSSTHLPSNCRNTVSIEEPSMTIYRGSKQDSNSTFLFAYNNRTIDSAVKDDQKTEMTSKNVSLRDSIQERPKFQPAADSTEPPYYMIDRNHKTEQGETRSSFFDLPNCEMFRFQSGAGQIEEVSVAVKEEDSQHYDRFPKGPQASVGEGTLCEDLVAVEQAPGRSSFNAKNVDKVPLNIKEQSCCHHSSLQPQIPSSLKLDEREEEKKSDRYNIASALHARQSSIDAGDKSALKPKKEETSFVGSSGSVLKIMAKMSGSSDAPVVLEAQKGEKSKMIEEEFEQKSNISLKGKNKAYKPVKIEPMDSDDISAPNLINSCYSVEAVTQYFLELPTVSVSLDGKLKRKRKIVRLRDPARRVWSVRYEERDGFRGLTRGWSALAKANNIQPGDMCMFGVESQSDGLLWFNIDRKSRDIAGYEVLHLQDGHL